MYRLGRQTNRCIFPEKQIKRLIPPGKALKSYLLTPTLLFGASFVAGFLPLSSIRKQMLDIVISAFGDFRDVTGGLLFVQILLRNVTVSLAVLLLGVLPGIVPLFAIGLNGFFLGVAYIQVGEVLGCWKAAWKSFHTASCRFLHSSSRPPTANGLESMSPDKCVGGRAIRQEGHGAIP